MDATFRLIGLVTSLFVGAANLRAADKPVVTGGHNFAKWSAATNNPG